MRGMQARILWKQAGAELAIKQKLKKLTNISPKKRSVSVIDVPGILIRSGAGDFGVCQDCPMGFFGNFSGMSECEPCAAGSFSNQSGVSSSAGPRNSSFKECVNMCRHHMVFDAVLNKLPPIRLEYRREEQQKSFFFSGSGDECLQCLPGTASDPGSAFCSDCEAGLGCHDPNRFLVQGQFAVGEFNSFNFNFVVS